MQALDLLSFAPIDASDAEFFFAASRALESAVHGQQPSAPPAALVPPPIVDRDGAAFLSVASSPRSVSARDSAPHCTALTPLADSTRSTARAQGQSHRCVEASAKACAPLTDDSARRGATWAPPTQSATSSPQPSAPQTPTTTRRSPRLSSLDPITAALQSAAPQVSINVPASASLLMQSSVARSGSHLADAMPSTSVMSVSGRQTSLQGGTTSSHTYTTSTLCAGLSRWSHRVGSATDSAADRNHSSGTVSSGTAGDSSRSGSTPLVALAAPVVVASPATGLGRVPDGEAVNNAHRSQSPVSESSSTSSAVAEPPLSFPTLAPVSPRSVSATSAPVRGMIATPPKTPSKTPPRVRSPAHAPASRWAKRSGSYAVPTLQSFGKRWERSFTPPPAETNAPLLACSNEHGLASSVDQLDPPSATTTALTSMIPDPDRMTQIGVFAPLAMSRVTMARTGEELTATSTDEPTSTAAKTTATTTTTTTTTATTALDTEEGPTEDMPSPAVACSPARPSQHHATSDRPPPVRIGSPGESAGSSATGTTATGATATGATATGPGRKLDEESHGSCTEVTAAVTPRSPSIALLALSMRQAINRPRPVLSQSPQRPSLQPSPPLPRDSPTFIRSPGLSPSASVTSSYALPVPFADRAVQDTSTPRATNISASGHDVVTPAAPEPVSPSGAVSAVFRGTQGTPVHFRASFALPGPEVLSALCPVPPLTPREGSSSRASSAQQPTTPTFASALSHTEAATPKPPTTQEATQPPAAEPDLSPASHTDPPAGGSTGEQAQGPAVRGVEVLRVEVKDQSTPPSPSSLQTPPCVASPPEAEHFGIGDPPLRGDVSAIAVTHCRSALENYRCAIVASLRHTKAASTPAWSSPLRQRSRDPTGETSGFGSCISTATSGRSFSDCCSNTDVGPDFLSETKAAVLDALGLVSPELNRKVRASAQQFALQKAKERTRVESAEKRLGFDPDPPKIHEVVPGLFVGSYHTAVERDTLLERGVTHVVCLIGMEPRFPEAITYLTLTAEDTAGYDMHQHWPQTTAFIGDALRSGGTVFVHCGAGVSRAPSVAAAFLIDTLGIDSVTAVRMLRAVRKAVRPNAGFLAQLETYAEAASSRRAKNHTLAR